MFEKGKQFIKDHKGEVILAGCVVGVSIFGIWYSYHTKASIEKMLVKKIGGGIVLDVPENVLNDAINIAVDREVGKAINKVSLEIGANARKDMQTIIMAEVNWAHTQIVNEVSNEVAKQVANIDTRKLSEEVRTKAKQMVIDKFDNNLDSLLTDFNDKLSNVAKIYESIAETMTKRKDSEAVLRIGV